MNRGEQNTLDRLDRLERLDLEAAIREHQTTTAVLVAVGVVIGVAMAAWVMSRPPRDKVGAEDPEAPLFI
ncbi:MULTISPECIES: hypothetical protein [Deinococcus]|uniref:Uncharacterized protein n=1 Tax=Deinococcus ruber TaxID=1848197 RepID=A0A918BZE8_9DEIO|nr:MULTISPECIES: hypothetical protein [Deinococcus]ULH16452.1 hypothetical protein MF271_07690 [Deinococcus sp. KNUC1210]GGQ97569.1 hypothetical protein GCM10008957_07530 [Deinococcus ruber]